MKKGSNLQPTFKKPPPPAFPASGVQPPLPGYAVFNLNKRCKVKLTNFGGHLLLKRNVLIFKFGYDQKTNILYTELWNIMNIFGDQLYNGATELPFVNNEIHIEA